MAAEGEHRGSAIVDLSRATTADISQPTVVPLPPIINAGYNLAKIFGAILAGYSIFAWIGIRYSETKFADEMEKFIAAYNVGSNSPDPAKIATFEAALKPIIEGYRQARTDEIDFNRTVIVNVLLPILTALLGYIFAHRSEGSTSK